VRLDAAKATIKGEMATPFWFGPADRPLFGWLHQPASGEARGGVVLCPPLGIEAICVYFTYRTLAIRLAEAGLAVLRFDYDGTGDSFGDQGDPGRTEAWEASVDAALRALDLTGVGSVGLVGMRIGAVLAASAAARRFPVLDAMVLWDPCVSGRSFLREQRAFRMLSIGGDDAGQAVDAPGMRFSPKTVQTLGQLDLPGVEGPLARRVLVLEDPERPRSKRLAKRLGPTAVEWVEATGQSALLDPPRQEPPYATIDLVGEWIAAAMDSPPTPLRVPLSGPAVVGRSASGGEVVERPVTLGPHELFGIVSEPTTPVSGPTIVFIAEGNTPHIGQSRLWVELGREWAASGRRVLRFDLSGNGDTPARPGQERHVPRAAASFDDVTDACRAVSPHDPSDVVLVGLCSGAYQSVEHALVHPTRGVCLINPVLNFLPPAGEPVDVARPARQRTRPIVVRLAGPPLRWATRRRAPVVGRRWEQALEAGWWPASVASRCARVPQAVWWVANRLLLENPAAVTLGRVVRAGADLVVICGPEDLAPIALGERSTLRRLERSGHFRLEVLDDLDHAGLRIDGRQHLKEALTRQIVGSYPSTRLGAAEGTGMTLP
jgi:alpha-beta hydrolase superfamily lysophospholipase